MEKKKIKFFTKPNIHEMKLKRSKQIEFLWKLWRTFPTVEFEE